MEEKVLSGKKHGMLTLLCCVAVMLLAVAGVSDNCGRRRNLAVAYSIRRSIVRRMDTPCGAQNIKASGGFGFNSFRQIRRHA